ATARTSQMPWLEGEEAAAVKEGESTTRATSPALERSLALILDPKVPRAGATPTTPNRWPSTPSSAPRASEASHSPLTRLSPGLPESCGGGSTNNSSVTSIVPVAGSPHAQARRAHSEPTSAVEGFPGRLPVPDSPPATVRDCMTCFESKVTAALVPCGHNLFCMECAIRICELNHPECPVCHTQVTQAIRIFS
ncbi:unnamed protein product, partial [Lampetra planeri]